MKIDARTPPLPPDLDVGVSGPEFLKVFRCKIVNCWIVWGSFLNANSYQIISHFIPEYVKRLFGYLICQRGGGVAALLRCGSAAPGLMPAHGVQSPIP